MRGSVVVTVVPKVEPMGPLTVTIQVRIDAATDRRLEAVVSETGRKLSDVVRLLLLAGLDLHEKDVKGKR